MSLHFTIRAIDGRSEKQFPDILAVEEYFGEALRHSNVSYDGVQRIEPSDREAELALTAYREASALRPIDLSNTAISIPLGDEDKKRLSRELRMSNNVNLGNGWFAIRSSVIEHAIEDVVKLQLITEPETKCRENTVVYNDYNSGLVVVQDLLGSAKQLEDLNNRPLVDTPAAVLHYISPINEDTGKRSAYPSFEGVCIGPKDIVVKTIQRSLFRAGHLHGNTDGGYIDFASKKIDSDEVYTPFHNLFQKVESMADFCQTYKANCNGALEGQQLINEAKKQLKETFQIDLDATQVELLLQNDDDASMQLVLNQLTEIELNRSNNQHPNTTRPTVKPSENANENSYKIRRWHYATQKALTGPFAMNPNEMITRWNINNQ